MRCGLQCCVGYMHDVQAMKINAKINGINHKLSAPPFPWMKQPYIVIGMESLSVLRACIV